MRTEDRPNGFRHVLWQNETGPELCSTRRVLEASPLYLAYLEPELTRVALVLADPRGENWRTGVLVYALDCEHTVSQLELLLEVLGLAKAKGFITHARAAEAEARLWRRRDTQ